MHVFALMVRDLCGYELPVSSVSVVAVVVTASGCLRLASVRGHIHVNKLKQFRAVATRHDKREYFYLGTVTASALLIWLRP